MRVLARHDKLGRLHRRERAGLQRLATLVLVLSMGWPVYGVSTTVTIPTEFWLTPRSGASVIAVPGLRNLLAELERGKRVKLLIRHGGGDEASLWGEELKAWLISLGVPSSRIELGLNLANKDHIVVETITE